MKPKDTKDTNKIGNEDIATLKKTIEQQASDIFKLKSIISDLPGDVYWKDKDGVYQGINETGRESLRKMGFSWKAEDIIGKTDYDLFDKETADAFRKNDLQIMTEGIENTRQESAVLPSGKNIVQLSIKRPLRDEKGEVVGIIGNTVDITELKETQDALIKAKEKIECASKAKSIFISNMSHDIRTPLAGIIGATQLLEKKLGESEDAQYAHMALLSAQRLNEFLNDVLKNMEADEMNEDGVYYTTFDLLDCVQCLKDLLLLRTKMKNIELEVYIDPAVPQYVVSDRLKIERILLNLLSNAIKFTEKGRVELTVNMLKKNNIEQFEFYVKDTGIGISEDKLPQVFDLFYRGTPAHEGKHEGSGLGLNIVKKYVALLEGEIKVTSQLEQGTVFQIVLPMLKGNANDVKIKKTTEITEEALNRQMGEKENEINKIASPIGHPQQPALSNEKQAILFIEDNMIVRKTVKKILENTGAIVHDAPDAITALKLAKSHAYNVILTDVGLPDISGDEWVALYRFWEKKNNKLPIPIFGLTGHAEREMKNSCLIAGMNDVFIKPLDDATIRIIQKANTPRTPPFLDDEAPKMDLGHELPENEKELFQLENIPIFDEKKGIDVVLNKETLATLLNILLNSDLPEEMSNLQKAHLNNNWKDIEKIAHKIKGSALYCGTIKLEHACRYMERYCKAGHTKNLENLYQQLLCVMEETKRSLGQIINSLENG